MASELLRLAVVMTCLAVYVGGFALLLVWAADSTRKADD